MDTRKKEIIDAIMSAIEVCWEKKLPINYRTIFTLLQLPADLMESHFDLDQEIPVRQESDIVIMKAMFSSKFALLD